MSAVSVRDKNGCFSWEYKTEGSIVQYLACRPSLLEAISSRFRAQLRSCQLFSLIGFNFSFITVMITAFRFTKCFCFAAEHNKDKVLEGKFRGPPKRQLSS